MNTPVTQAMRAKELGERTREELAEMFGQMFAGWDRGVNMEGPDMGFRETPMTPMELEARYVAAEIGVNIYEMANAAAFAPIRIYNEIQKRLGPLFAEQQHVYCVRCVDDDGDGPVHIFSTEEKQKAFAETDPRDHVLYDYVIDCPERMEQTAS